jgi:hypothetical protein
MVLRPVGVVDAVVDRSVHRLKGDLLRHGGGDDPPGLLPHRGLVPTVILPVVAAHVEGAIDRDGPNPRRGAVRLSVLTDGEMCKSSASAILRSSSFDQVVMVGSPSKLLPSVAILIVGDLFHPLDHLTVEILLNGDMRHGGGWRRAMPMLLARREPDHIAGMNLFNQTDLALHPPATGCDHQGLTQRVSVPCCSSAGLERDTGTGRACRSVCLKQRVNAHQAGKPVGRSFVGRL